MPVVLEPLPDDRQGRSLPIDWRNVVLLLVVHVAALGGMAVYVPVHGLTLSATIIGLVLTAISIFSISAGYHRLFSHRAYEAHPVLRFFLLAFGAGAFQNSALAWAADHRRHHGSTDTDEDPYDARRGFWYSHIGWVMRKSNPDLPPMPVRDLERDPLVVWQDRHSALVGIAFGLVLPTLLGLACGDAWGGFVVGAAVRLLLVYHATFSINSFAHRFGTQPYSDRSTARDSLLTALISMGEGYHNFHHTFPADYRNGVRAHQFDPTKWALRSMATIGLVRQLRCTPPPAILRARLRMDERRLDAMKVPPAARQHLQQLRVMVDRAVVRWHDLMALYETTRLETRDQARDVLAGIRAEARAAGRELRRLHATWNRAVRSPDFLMAWTAASSGATST
jgi:stearoyl-CoA desaturase (delta-9 desaturase)